LLLRSSVVPSLVGQLLFGVELLGAAMTVARVGSCAVRLRAEAL
jgi:hypothetical protein